MEWRWSWELSWSLAILICFHTFEVEKERNDQLTGIVTGDTVPEDLLKIELSEQTPGEAGEGLNMMKEGSPAKSVASSVQHSNR